MISRREFLRSAGQAGLWSAGFSRGVVDAGTAGQDVAPLFEEIPASASGITWRHENARSPARFLPESLGPGCAFLDFDNDGWMDIYLVNSGPCDFFQPAGPLKNALLRNNRDGTFTDVTAKAGVAAPGWTTSAVWFDYDNDGLLDLFVCSFVQYGLDKGLVCAEKKKDGGLYYHYCIPHLFKPTPSLLFHNNGDGTFTQAGKGTEIDRALGKALGVVATDINNDGLMDLFVGNDTAQNFLFFNRGKNRWQERGVPAGVAYGASGQLRSGMGVDAADVDGDGWQDLLVANIDHEMFSLYKNNGGDLFTDVARDHGLAEATRLLSGWGLKFFDFDNDGQVDLLLANGHPDDTIALRAPEVKYREPLLLLRHDGRRLRNVSRQAGPVFSKAFPARGLAVGDFNNDGRLDVLVGCNGEAPVLLRNNAGAGHHWVGLKLQGVTCNRDAVGARLTWSAGGVRKSRVKTSGGSYLSSHDPREVLGLGRATALDWLEVTWPQPSGKIERFTKVPVDRYLTITEGKGISQVR